MVTSSVILLFVSLPFSALSPLSSSQLFLCVSILCSLAEEDDGPLSEQETSASTKRTSLSRGISITSNLEERHIPMVKSKTYPDEDEDEESLEKIMFQSNQAFLCLGTCSP